MKVFVSSKFAYAHLELLNSVMVKIGAEKFFFENKKQNWGKRTPHNPGEEISLFYACLALLIKMFSKTHSDRRLF